jgi:hypothetical protein
MTDFEKIRRMVDSYEKHLQEDNELWNCDKVSSKLKESGDALDKEFSAICDEVTKPVQDLLQNLARVGVEVSTIDAVVRYNEPYHAIWMKVGKKGRASTHIFVEGYKYR